MYVGPYVYIYTYQLYYINAVAGSKEESMGRKNNRGRLDRWVINKKGRGSPPVKVRWEGFTGVTKIPRPGRWCKKRCRFSGVFLGIAALDVVTPFSGKHCSQTIGIHAGLGDETHALLTWIRKFHGAMLASTREDGEDVPGGFFNGGWIPTMKERKQIQWNEQLRLAKIKIRRNKWQETNENTWKPGAWRCIRRRKTIQSEGMRFRNTIQKLRKDVGRAVRSLKELPIQQLLNPQ